MEHCDACRAEKAAEKNRHDVGAWVRAEKDRASLKEQLAMAFRVVDAKEAERKNAVRIGCENIAAREAAESESTRLKAEMADAEDRISYITQSNEVANNIIRELRAELTRLREREKAMTSPEMIERLAAIEHERWAGWMRHLFSKCVPGEQMLGVVGPSIPAWAEERWKRQMNTPYAELSEEEKESDRVEVRKTLAALSAEPERRETGK